LPSASNYPRWLGSAAGVDMSPGNDLREQAGVAKDRANTTHRIHWNDNLEALMTRYQEGDFAAATALVYSVGPQLHRFFSVQFVSRADADDLLQETWLRIHKVRHTYRPGEPVLPWFYSIARHVRVDHYRKAIRTATRERRLDEVSHVPVKLADESGLVGGLETMLAPLPDSQREVIEMLKLAGMSLEEVARATASTVGSVKQKVHRAYKKLRQTMRPAARDREGITDHE
jgi:RNA polymerase sigma-70 factor, ECF subfamily